MPQFSLVWSRENGPNGFSIVRAETQEAATAMALHMLRTDGSGYGYYKACPMYELTEDQVHQIWELICEWRAIAQPVGPQHALWDSINDAEALMSGRKTMLPPDVLMKEWGIK